MIGPGSACSCSPRTPTTASSAAGARWRGSSIGLSRCATSRSRSRPVRSARGFAPDTLAREVREATGELGHPESQLDVHDFEVRTFPERGRTSSSCSIALWEDRQPDAVFQPSLHDVHQDHRRSPPEGLRAFKRTTILGYQIPGTTSTSPTRRTSRSSAHVERKVAALARYASQQHRATPTPSTSGTSRATHGINVNREYARSSRSTGSSPSVAGLASRTLGTSGLEVSCLGLGCMGMSSFYGPGDQDEATATIHRALGARRHAVRHRRRLPGIRRQRGARGSRPGGPARAGPDRDEVRPHLRRRTRCHSTAGPSTWRGPAAVTRPARRRAHRPVLPAPARSAGPDRGDRGSVRWPSSCRPARSGTWAYRRFCPRRYARAHAVHPITAVQTEYSLYEDSLEQRLPGQAELKCQVVLKTFDVGFDLSNERQQSLTSEAK